MGDGELEQLLQRYAQFCDRHLSMPPAIDENEVTIAMRTLSNSVSIPVLDELSKWDFFDQYFPREPLIVKGLIRHWPAVKNWSFTHLHKILCHRVLPVEQASKYTDSNWAQMLITGSQFFTTCTLPMDEKGPFVPTIEKNCWIGRGGTISPLHTDPRENMFSQMVLEKIYYWTELGSMLASQVPQILAAVFECTLEMINKDMEAFPEHRTNFFQLIHALTVECFPGSPCVASGTTQSHH
ncbi:unnamed protein product [Cylicocyclus nassatus]|uniref:Exportin-1 C-terminal domain-containing protein n=1 Tax=Cylicocyclus nassatus TaxID=53992 RepID=A0AA36DPS5_CYLNA|nr:unnamed protein product [Cylicocyclus nassatus]